MLEGREVTIKKFSEVFTDNPTKRLDSQFFLKEYVSLLKTILSNKSEKLQSLSSWITQGPNPTFDEDGVPCLTGRNINNGRVNYNNSDYINEEEYKSLERFQLKIGDTLITLKGKGSIGKIGYVTDPRPAIFSRDIGIIRPAKINSAFVNAYILSKFGVKIIERGETGGTGQSTLTTSYLKEIDIPRFKIEKQIGDLVAKSEKILEKSQYCYKQAENLLLEAIGLKDFEPSKEKTNVKNFSECFQISERLDAEFYQRKYDEIESKIKQNKKWNSLGDLQTKIDTGEYAPAYFKKDEAEDLTFYIRSTNIKRGQIELDDDYYVQKKNFVRIAEKGDIVTARVGSVGIFGEVRKELEGAIYSDNIICFRLPDSFTPSVYTILFNTKYYFDLIDRLARGSVQQRLNQETLKDLIVPFIEPETQEEISEIIEESFRLKKESETLLETAKRAVEMAIEETEDAAIEFINTLTI